MLEKFPQKKKKKTLDESPSTPQAKVMRRSANTGEQSSPEDVAARGKKNEKNSTKLQDARPTTSFLDRLLESTIASELSAHETQALMQRRTTSPANSAGLTVRQRMHLAKKKNGNQKNKKQEKTGDSKKKEAATGSKKTKKVKSDAGLNSNVNEKKLENQKGGEDSTAEKRHKKKKKKGHFSKKTKAPLGRRGTQEAEEVGIQTEPAEAEGPKKKRPHSHTEEDLAKIDRAKARQIVTSWAYHAALTKNFVTKTAAQTMNPEEVQRLNDVTKQLARDAGKAAGAMFDQQRPRDQ